MRPRFDKFLHPRNRLGRFRKTQLKQKLARAAEKRGMPLEQYLAGRGWDAASDLGETPGERAFLRGYITQKLAGSEMQSGRKSFTNKAAARHDPLPGRADQYQPPPPQSPGGEASREHGIADSIFREAERAYLAALGGIGDPEAAKAEFVAARERLDRAAGRVMDEMERMSRVAAHNLMAPQAPGTSDMPYFPLPSGQKVIHRGVAYGNTSRHTPPSYSHGAPRLSPRMWEFHRKGRSIPM